MKFVSLVKASRSGLVYLARLKEATSNLDAWYYVQLNSKAEAPIFLEKIKTGITLTDYGNILYSGWGINPPEYIIKEINEQFS